MPEIRYFQILETRHFLVQCGANRRGKTAGEVCGWRISANGCNTHVIRTLALQCVLFDMFWSITKENQRITPLQTGHWKLQRPSKTHPFPGRSRSAARTNRTIRSGLLQQWHGHKHVRNNGCFHIQVRKSILTGHWHNPSIEHFHAMHNQHKAPTMRATACNSLQTQLTKFSPRRMVAACQQQLYLQEVLPLDIGLWDRSFYDQFHLEWLLCSRSFGRPVKLNFYSDNGPVRQPLRSPLLCFRCRIVFTWTTRWKVICTLQVR